MTAAGAKRKPERPKVYVDARGQELTDVNLMRNGHYAIRVGHFAVLLSTHAAEAMAWAILQRQAKRQKTGGRTP